MLRVHLGSTDVAVLVMLLDPIADQMPQLMLSVAEGLLRRDSETGRFRTPVAPVASRIIARVPQHRQRGTS